ncbi:MAG: sodium:calcium symporter [Pedosphaera sp.]|nr:sodium:calcium symporter [Pedosphaera sp.]
MVGLFLAASLLTVWRLESMSSGGLEGTVLGTLVTPYITGMGNLIFAFVLARKNGSATEVLTNCLVNNVTNMTLVLGLPAVIWNMNLFSAKKTGAGKKSAKAKGSAQVQQVNRLSLLLTLTAVLFFTGMTWAVGSDGQITFIDGLVLVGLFLFWQCFHVFEVLKTNARQNRGFDWMLPFDLALLALGGYAIYLSTDWLVAWISNIHTGFISVKYIGWLSGWLMVLPNALLAIYYGWTKRPEVVYTSQVGDNHICIPLCIGIFALFKTITVPAFFKPGVFILLGATLLHFLFIAAFGRLPRVAGFLLIAAYGYFLYAGLLQ